MKQLLPALALIAFTLTAGGCRTANERLEITSEAKERAERYRIRERQHEENLAKLSVETTRLEAQVLEAQKTLVDVKSRVDEAVASTEEGKAKVEVLQQLLVSASESQPKQSDDDEESGDDTRPRVDLEQLMTAADDAALRLDRGLSAARSARESLERVDTEKMTDTVARAQAIASAPGDAADGTSPDALREALQTKLKWFVSALLIGLAVLAAWMWWVRRWTPLAGLTLILLAGTLLAIQWTFPTHGSWVALLLLVFTLPPLIGVLEHEGGRTARRNKNLRNNIRHEYALLSRLAVSAQELDADQLEFMGQRLEALQLQSVDVEPACRAIDAMQRLRTTVLANLGDGYAPFVPPPSPEDEEAAAALGRSAKGGKAKPAGQKKPGKAELPAKQKEAITEAHDYARTIVMDELKTLMQRHDPTRPRPEVGSKQPQPDPAHAPG